MVVVLFLKKGPITMEIINIPVERINPAIYNPRVDLQPGD